MGNAIDITNLTMPDCVPDVRFPGSIGKCKTYRVYNGLVALSSNNPYAASGQYFTNLLTAQAELLEARKKAKEQLRQYLDYLQSLGNYRAFQFVSALSFEELVAFLNQQPLYTYTAPTGILNFLLQDQRYQHLLRRVHARIALICCKIEGAVPRFCGVSWTRRLWFLMHGIRPPKAWAFSSLAFECALL